MPDVYQGVVGRQLRVPLRDSLGTTGLALEDFTIYAASEASWVADAEATLELILIEVDSENFPGYYELALTPVGEGLLYLSVAGTDTHHLAVQAAHEGVDLVGTVQAGAEGTYTVTVEDDGGSPVSGATVKIYSSGGTRLVARGTTNAAGQVAFGLPTGSYYVRVYVDGYDCTEVNPTEILVVADPTVDPVVLSAVPESPLAGGSVTLLGTCLGDTLADVDVLFDGEVVAASALAEGGTAVVASVPEAAGGPVSLQVRKPDPSNPGEYLVSNIVWVEIV